MPQQVGKFDFTGIPAAGQPDTQGPPQFDFSGISAQPPAEGASPPQVPLHPLARLGGMVQTALGADNWPMIGGAIGGLAGGPLGAVLGGAGGEAYQQLYHRATGSAPTPASPLEAAKDIAIQGGVQGALEKLGGVVPKVLKSGAESVYRGYLKPSLAKVNVKKAREIVQTALRESLPVTKAGEERAGRLISDLNAQVNSILANARGTVDLHRVAEKVRAFAQRYNKPGAPSADFDAVMKVADDIDQHPSLALYPGAKLKRLDVPVSQAQETKQALDRAIGETGFGVERSAATEARKVGRRATREAIEAKAPEVGPLNARERQLIDARDALSRAAAREENKSPLIGMNTLTAGAIGAYGAYERDPASGLVMAMAARGALTPAVATRAAILASRLAKMPGTAPADAARLAIAIVTSGQEDPNQQHDQQ